jgi:hypothetical protein
MPDTMTAEMVADLKGPKDDNPNIYDKRILDAVNAPDGTTSRRAELRQALEDSGNPVAELLAKQTPAQEAWGDMISELATTAKHYEAVEKIFSQFARAWNNDVDLTYQEKITAFMHAVGFMSCDERAYRLIRKIFVNAIQEV